MRIHFQVRPWDLYTALGYAFVIGGTLLVTHAGSLLTLLLVLFVPGYLVVAALFPANTELEWIERIALSLGLSIAIVPLLGLILNFTPWGIRLEPVIAAIVLFAAFAGATAWWRRLRLPADTRLSATITLAMPNWRDLALVDKGLIVALLLTFAISAGAITYVALTPGPSERFSEFYVLGPSGNASGYPTNLGPSQPAMVIVGIANHEGATLDYAVRVDLVGLQVVYNATSGFNQTVEVNRTTWSWLNVTLDKGQDSTQPYFFRIDYTGLWKVQFLLYKNGVLTSQKLHLFVRVA